MKQLLFLSVLIFALSACKSLDKLYQEGNYKQVLSKLEGKAKKGKLDRKERSLLVRAMNKYAEEVNAEVLNSMDGPKPSEWLKAKRKMIKLDDKINDVVSYSQIRESDINPSRADELIPLLNDQLYEYSFNEYDIAIGNYIRTNDRDYAKKAYAHAQKMYDYDGDPVFVDSLAIEAVELGHRIIFLDIDGPIADGFSFRNNFEDRLDFNDDVFNTFTEFFTSDAHYDLSIDVDIDRKDFNESTRSDRHTKRVVDYYETQVDTSSNSTTEVPVYKEIAAIVQTVEVVRYVQGGFQYEIKDNRNLRRFDYDRGSHRVEQIEYYYFLESGDEEAVPSNIRLSQDNSWDDWNAYDDLIEQFYEELAYLFNNEVNIKDRLL